MSTLQNPLIAVGVADSPEAEVAQEWAAHLARRIGGRIRLVHAFVWADHDVNTEPIPGVKGSGLRAAAECLMADASHRVAQIAPDTEIVADIVEGQRARVMLEASDTADIVVVGARGLGKFLAAIVGSTSRTLVNDGGSPVVIVRRATDLSGNVGLAYDAGVTTQQTVARAVELAEALGVGVTVIHPVGLSEAETARAHEDAQAAIAALSQELAVESLSVPKGSELAELAAATEHLSVQVVSDPASGPRADRLIRVTETPVWVERQ